MAKLIAVVDDEPDNIIFVEAVLKKEGFSISSASDGEEGFARAKQESPDLIILDVEMDLLSL